MSKPFRKVRYQFDSEWQADFGRLADSMAAMKEHIAAGLQLRDAGVLDEARRELALADEEKERAELLVQKLEEMT